MSLVSRDPFAREEIHRTGIRPTGDESCRFCGVSVWQTPRKRLWRYWIETDGGTKHEISGQFCSIGCMRSYHG